ncbi:MAG: carboxypeptidase regulatory-like domain-containing protein, partial [Nitrosarchaeum sp.]|nr:carboxypeptidase regulatory-like domain-containing protein [Nitrosarchaeum sp.]
MKLDTPLKKAAYVLILATLILSSINGLIVITEYIGMITTSHAGKGGYIYEMNVERRFPVERWAAVYGLAVAVGFNNPQLQTLQGGQLEEENLIFDCFQEDIENEVYASTVPREQVDLTNVQVPTLAEIDTWINRSASEFTSATNTFTQTIQVTLGASTYTVPATYTYKVNESTPATFATGVLKDGQGRLFIVAKVVDYQTGFNNRIFNYQLLVPLVSPGNPQVWYFWPDPNDVCPDQGNGTDDRAGNVEGNVTDESGLPIQGVIVEVSGRASVSDSAGFYSITDIPVGNHSIFAVKEGYQVYYSNVSVLEDETTIHNIVLTQEVQENPYTDIGPGQNDNPPVTPNEFTDFGPGEDVGPGQYDFQPIIEQPKVIEGQEIIITLKDLKRKLREGEYRQEAIRILSYRDSTIQAIYKIDGNLTDIIVLDKAQSAIPPNGEDQLTITIYGSKPPGIYNGSILFDGDFNYTLPVEIEILDKNKLPVEALL